MTQPFPDNIYLTGAAAPSGVECDAPDLVIEGELPTDLEGVYFRNGPDPLYPPVAGQEYHWFHGDGMIQRFEFSGGRVSWRNRWVRTEKYALERKAGRSLFGVLGNPFGADPSVADAHYNTANTHIVWHGQRLLALMEGTIAVEMNPDTLETVGNFDFDGAIDGPITAHPKFDHATGEMIFFGNQAAGPFTNIMRYNVADRDGRLIRNEMIEVPYAAFVHDFMVTRHHVVFPIYPLAFNIERAMSGVPLAWEPDRGTHFGVMPRDGTPADITWHEMEPRWSFHVMNAWETDDAIHIDICASNATEFAPMLDGKLARGPDTYPTLRRWTLGLGGHKAGVKEEWLDDFTCEFPRTDDRYMTVGYRHGYAVGGERGPLAFNRLLHYDAHSGARKVWGEDRYLLGEPILAPRSADADEGDGHILNLAYNQESGLSELLVFEAAGIEAGPVARVKCPLRVPAGFHGSWVGATT